MVFSSQGHHEPVTRCLWAPVGSRRPVRRGLLVMGSILVSLHHPGLGKDTFVSIWIPFGVIHPVSRSRLDHVCSCPRPDGSCCIFFSLCCNKNVKQSWAALILQPRATLFHCPLAAGQHVAGELHPPPCIPRDCIPLMASLGAASLSQDPQGPHPSPGIPLSATPGTAGQEPGNLPWGKSWRGLGVLRFPRER